MKKRYAHFKDFPAAQWRWPSFSPREVACKGTGELLVDDQALDKLQALRTALSKPLVLTSAFRSLSHNKRVGGAKNSRHMQGDAFDVRMDKLDQEQSNHGRRLQLAQWAGVGGLALLAYFLVQQQS